MKINSLRVEKLHGYLSFDIAFHPDLNFLIGINGSGKTSAVRAVMALLGPAVRDLAQLDFRELQVSVTHDGQETSVAAVRTDTEISLSVEGVAEPLAIPILHRPRGARGGPWEEHELEYYRDQEALNARSGVLERIAQLPTPMFLDLERRAQVGVVRAVRPQVGARHHLRSTLLGGTLVESLRDAEALAEHTYRRIQAIQRRLADRLKQDLILTHFRIEQHSSPTFLHPPSGKEIRKLRQRQELIDKSLHAIGTSSEEMRATVASFFDAIYDISGKLANRDVIELLSSRSDDAELASRWFGLQPQLGRVNAVIEHVEKYNRKVQEVYRPIQLYLDLVNKFLNDSGKSLDFDPTGEIGVLMTSQAKTRPITALSSGERQLVVILTHLAFNDAARQANVLIIDEPELSLHVRWQELFVDALVGASEDLQVILATHSPSIILDHVDACIDVMEARR